ncbi:MAG: hypothetical protein NC489_19735 [Ruminococcus flavefaciens]|nr:hypothetical protein [Ruminococcus flavefaciens]
MKEKAWRTRLNFRTDLVARVSHLTGRGASSDAEAFNTLWKILTEKKLIASGHEGDKGFIIGDTGAVCFQEVPLPAIAENILFSEALKIETPYHGFGIRVNRGSLYKKGGRPVIYGEKDKLMDLLPADQYWRIVSMDLDDKDAIVDWTHEREWRIAGDFVFEWSDIEVVLKDHDYFSEFVKRCFEEEKTDLLKGVNGIITLDSVIS